MNHTVACAEINSRAQFRGSRMAENRPFEIMRLCAKRPAGARTLPHPAPGQKH